MESEVGLEIKAELDIVRCRRAARDMAVEIGFGIADQTRIVTAASELARNIVQYADSGKMLISVISTSSTKGIKMIFKDNGPGLDPDEAMTFGFSTSKGIGVGLPGSQRLMDEFEIQSEKGKGTRVTAIKWLRQ
jgi:serine/threonine-protein kinase RsbT